MATGPKGERRLCGACKKWHQPHCPDNCILVPICPECWEKCNIQTRVWTISQAMQASTLLALDNSIHELLDGIIAAMTTKLQSTDDDYSDN